MSAAVSANGWRARVGDWVESRGVQNLIIGLIVFNAVMLGLETSETAMARAGGLIVLAERSVLAVFVLEIALKLYAWDLRFFRNAWNVFDFAIVAVALVPASGPFAILRALRILRVLRLITRVQRLRHIIESLLKALPSIGWIGVLLLMVFYIFGVMGTQLFGDAFPRFFGTLGRTMYTLFQIMTLESWSMAVARPVLEEFPYAWIYFVTFILVTAFTVLNLFIGIIVNTMQEGYHESEEQSRQEIETRARMERQEMLELIREIDQRLERLEDGGGARLRSRDSEL